MTKSIARLIPENDTVSIVILRWMKLLAKDKLAPDGLSCFGGVELRKMVGLLDG